MPTSEIIVSEINFDNRARAEVLVTLTQDLGKILSSLASLKIGGEIEFSSALQVAQVRTGGTPLLKSNIVSWCSSIDKTKTNTNV